MAVAAGRRVAMIRWDAGLVAFTGEEVPAKYPEVESGSHPAMRKAAGPLGRQAVANWIAHRSDPEDMPIGKIPIIDNRYSYFIQKRSDEAEAGPASSMTLFVYPAPIRSVRE